MSAPTAVTAPIDPALQAHRDRLIAAYLLQVRAELRDLDEDELEELTGGLEADVRDALAGTHRTPGEAFGSPEDYAAELRAAAGLGAAKPSRDHLLGALSKAADQARADTRERFAQVVRGQRWWRPVREFMTAMRSAWWVGRAFLAYHWIAQCGISQNGSPVERHAMPHDLLTWAAMLGLVIISVELGRRRLPALVGGLVIVLDLYLVFLVAVVTPVGLYWS